MIYRTMELYKFQIEIAINSYQNSFILMYKTPFISKEKIYYPLDFVKRINIFKTNIKKYVAIDIQNDFDDLSFEFPLKITNASLLSFMVNKSLNSQSNKTTLLY